MGDWSDIEERFNDFRERSKEFNEERKTKKRKDEQMASKTKIQAPAQSTALVPKAPEAMEPWEREMFEEAQAATGQVAGLATGGSTFSIRAGQLSFNKNPIPGNEVAVVVLAALPMRAYYEGDFDPDNMAPPACYAFNRDPKTEPWVPYKDVAAPVCKEGCLNCPNNVFGSAKGGTRKGKACPERIRLAVIPAGQIENSKFDPAMDVESLTAAEVAFFPVPTTSMKAYASYVAALKSTTQRPPFAVVTRIKVRPDPKSQVAVEFSREALADKDVIATLRERSKEGYEKVLFPFPAAGEEKTEAPAKGAPAGKAPRNKFAK